MEYLPKAYPRRGINIYLKITRGSFLPEIGGCILKINGRKLQTNSGENYEWHKPYTKGLPKKMTGTFSGGYGYLLEDLDEYLTI